MNLAALNFMVYPWDWDVLLGCDFLYFDCVLVNCFVKLVQVWSEVTFAFHFKTKFAKMFEF